jgi:hypothetical protein
MITNTIVLFDPSGVLVYTGHIVTVAPMMLDPSSCSELIANFTNGLVAGSALAAVLLGYRYVKKALGWVDGGND